MAPGSITSITPPPGKAAPSMNNPAIPDAGSSSVAHDSRPPTWVAIRRGTAWLPPAGGTPPPASGPGGGQVEQNMLRVDQRGAARWLGCHRDRGRRGVGAGAAATLSWRRSSKAAASPRWVTSRAANHAEPATAAATMRGPLNAGNRSEGHDMPWATPRGVPLPGSGRNPAPRRLLTDASCQPATPQRHGRAILATPPTRTWDDKTTR